ncbi:MAG TPA: sulfite exporter TauE/SafE family protein [Candidatus Stackebrandtia faecavium]|nr:sulfite exporter TauE/SafE family protein [Candidatus Stackebrandtia faecavium]
MTALSLPILAALALIGLVGGIGITAIGPGGVLPTIGLFALTDLTPAQVAGTAIVTHIATGVVATAAYWRSGHLRAPATRRTAAILAGSAVLGTPVGVGINDLVSPSGFGQALAVLLVVVAGLVWYRQRRTQQPASTTHPKQLTVALVGFAVACASGLVGVGGPMLTVPILIALGVGVLESLAAAQVQSIVIAGVGTVGYMSAGAIDWPLAVLVGVPELIGVLLGWKLARMLPTRVLQRALVIALLVLAPYLALHG